MAQDIAHRLLADLTLPWRRWTTPPLIAIIGLPCPGKTGCAAYLAARLATPAATVQTGKFVITPAHFVRIRRYLEMPGTDEVVWTIDTSAEPVAALLAPLCGHLDDLLAYCGCTCYAISGTE